jgi:formylglycine-generating enzyme required for sulfatase activity
VKIDAPISNVKDGWFLPGAGRTEWFKDAEFAAEMVVVPSGEFWMGSKDGEGEANERPRHKVTIPRPLAVGKYPVTFEEWDAYVGAGGDVERRYRPMGPCGRGRQPVIEVSWYDAQDYLKWLSEETGKPYRLLSEAEWEYCCRAGTETAYSFGDKESDLDRYAWYDANSGGDVHPVGQKEANAFGLHDMHGNVWEWCEDCWYWNYYYAPADGSAWTAGNREGRVFRGGAWLNVPLFFRAAFRDWSGASLRNIDLGFRLARTLDP